MPVPLAGAVTMAVLPAGQQDDIQARLDLMNTLVADLPAGTTRTAARPGPAPDAGELTIAEGAGLRTLRSAIFERDPTGLSAACAASRHRPTT